jgi:hypothetical protein
VTVAELAAKSIAAIGKSVHLVVRQAFSAPLVRQAILRTIEQEFFKAYRERLGVEVVAAAK